MTGLDRFGALRTSLDKTLRTASGPACPARHTQRSSRRTQTWVIGIRNSSRTVTPVDGVDDLAAQHGGLLVRDDAGSR